MIFMIIFIYVAQKIITCIFRFIVIEKPARRNAKNAKKKLVILVIEKPARRNAKKCQKKTSTNFLK